MYTHPTRPPGREGWEHGPNLFFRKLTNRSRSPMLRGSVGYYYPHTQQDVDSRDHRTLLFSLKYLGVIGMILNFAGSLSSLFLFFFLFFPPLFLSFMHPSYATPSLYNRGARGQDKKSLEGFFRGAGGAVPESVSSLSLIVIAQLPKRWYLCCCSGLSCRTLPVS